MVLYTPESQGLQVTAASVYDTMVRIIRASSVIWQLLEGTKFAKTAFENNVKALFTGRFISGEGTSTSSTDICVSHFWTPGGSSDRVTDLLQAASRTIQVLAAVYGASYVSLIMTIIVPIQSILRQDSILPSVVKDFFNQLFHGLASPHESAVLSLHLSQGGPNSSLQPMMPSKCSRAL